MSTSVTLSGTQKSAKTKQQRNPFTGKMQAVETYEMTAAQRKAVDAVLKRHGAKEDGDGNITILLENERHPKGFPLQGKRDGDGSLTFFDKVSVSNAGLAIMFELAKAGDLAIDGEGFWAVTSREAQARVDMKGPEYAVVGSAEELAELVRSFGEF